MNEADPLAPFLDSGDTEVLTWRRGGDGRVARFNGGYLIAGDPDARAVGNAITGANKSDYHVTGFNWARDVNAKQLQAAIVADIRNVVNEAALSATRLEKDEVEMSDFDLARDKVLMGSKREEVLVGKEKLMTAYHESGHALLAWLIPSSDRVHKVSVIPRGRALGATQILPEEDRLNISESELHTRLVFLLGGRMAEKIRFDEFTAGAEDDLKRATQLARRMVTHWGMSERLGPVAFRAHEEHPFLGREMSEPREFSEHTAQVIDEEIVRILREASKRAEDLLQEHRDKLDALASALDRLLGDRGLRERMGTAGRRRVLEGFSTAVRLDRLEGLYRRLAHPTGSA